MKNNLTKQESIELLKETQEFHPLWNNSLLKECTNGSFNKEDFKIIFSQYYHYSKQFTKLLAVGLLKCDDDYHRSLLSENLWEERGEKDPKKRHSEIYRKFLTKTLGVNLNETKYEPYAELFFKNYMELCLVSEPSECIAILSFATEGIVSRLYEIFRTGLLKAGVTYEDLEFFNIHIECDDDHALTLEKIMLSYHEEEGWAERCQRAIKKGLDLRNKFFSDIYEAVCRKNIDTLIHKKNTSENPSKNTAYSIRNGNKSLYRNIEKEKNIDFLVDRIPVKAEVLDPRILVIPPGKNNENHHHAHETILLILEGEGEVHIDQQKIPIKAESVVYINRWAHHQTFNTSQSDLRIFAVTDYGLTKMIPSNSDHSYRLTASL